MSSKAAKPDLSCEKCCLPTRWCICPAQRAIHSVLELGLLTHQREYSRASSSGNLVNRVFASCTQHIWHTSKPPGAATVVNADREVWLLHPNGQLLPDTVEASAVQVILLDGSWTETGLMARSVSKWGRLVSLPLQGSSRYWLREKQQGGRFSTAEALLFLLQALGLAREHTAFTTQFELHVYAHLRARGRKELAAQFLAQSPIRSTLEDFLRTMHEPRPL